MTTWRSLGSERNWDVVSETDQDEDTEDTEDGRVITTGEASMHFPQ